jgi:hypothetical protein
MAQNFGETTGLSPERASHRHPGSFDPSTSKERLGEIADVLAIGLMRVLARKSSGKPGQTRESSLDFSATESGHPTPVSGRMMDD